MLLLTYSKPSLSSLLLVCLFFGVLFYFLYSLFLLLGAFLKLTQKRTIAAVLAGFLTATQILMTFHALRFVDALLLSLVVGLIAWYMSKLR